jgi:hypothetical protein
MNELTKQKITSDLNDVNSILESRGDTHPLEDSSRDVKKYRTGSVSLYRSFARTLRRFQSNKLSPLQYQQAGGQHVFVNSPNLTRQFNAAFPVLDIIANTKDSRCFSSRNDTLNFCNEPTCSVCPECVTHRNELKKALDGITASGGESADEMRHVHMGKLLDTLNSWSMHMFNRGSDARSFNIKLYDNDGYNHKTLGSMFRGMFQNILKGGNIDYVNSGYTAGSPHNPEDMVK